MSFAFLFGCPGVVLKVGVEALGVSWHDDGDDAGSRFDWREGSARMLEEPEATVPDVVESIGPDEDLQSATKATGDEVGDATYPPHFSIDELEQVSPEGFVVAQAFMLAQAETDWERFGMKAWAAMSLGILGEDEIEVQEVDGAVGTLKIAGLMRVPFDIQTHQVLNGERATQMVEVGDFGPPSAGWKSVIHASILNGPWDSAREPRQFSSVEGEALWARHSAILRGLRHTLTPYYLAEVSEEGALDRARDQEIQFSFGGVELFRD